MTVSSARNRSNSAPATLSHDQSLINRRITEFKQNDRKRSKRPPQIRMSKPKIDDLTLRDNQDNAKTQPDLLHSTPVVKKAKIKSKSKSKKTPATPPFGIDGKVLRNAIARATGNCLKMDRHAAAIEKNFFQSFSNILEKCLAGHTDFSLQEYDTFVSAASALSAYLMPEEESMLEKLEKVSFIQ